MKGLKYACRSGVASRIVLADELSSGLITVDSNLIITRVSKWQDVAGQVIADVINLLITLS